MIRRLSAESNGPLHRSESGAQPQSGVGIVQGQEQMWNRQARYRHSCGLGQPIRDGLKVHHKDYGGQGQEAGGRDHTHSAYFHQPCQRGGRPAIGGVAGSPHYDAIVGHQAETGLQAAEGQGGLARAGRPAHKRPPPGSVLPVGDQGGVQDLAQVTVSGSSTVKRAPPPSA